MQLSKYINDQLAQGSYHPGFCVPNLEQLMTFVFSVFIIMPHLSCKIMLIWWNALLFVYCHPGSSCLYHLIRIIVILSESYYQGQTRIPIWHMLLSKFVPTKSIEITCAPLYNRHMAPLCTFSNLFKSAFKVLWPVTTQVK